MIIVNDQSVDYRLVHVWDPTNWLCGWSESVDEIIEQTLPMEVWTKWSFKSLINKHVKSLFSSFSFRVAHRADGKKKLIWEYDGGSFPPEAPQSSQFMLRVAESLSLCPVRPPHNDQTSNCLIWPLSDLSSDLFGRKVALNTPLRRAACSTIACTFCACARCNKPPLQRVALVSS